MCGHSVKESELLEQIAQVGASITQEQRLLGQLKEDELLKKIAVQTNLSALSGVQMGLEGLLQRLRDFNASSSSLFSDIDAVHTAIGRGLAVARSAFKAGSNTFELPNDMTWADDIRGAVARYDEELFVREMADNYGWDEAKARCWYPYKSQYGYKCSEISLMATVCDGISKKFPNLSQEQQDYLWLRIMGGATDGPDDFEQQAKWDATAGPLSAKPYYLFVACSLSLLTIPGVSAIALPADAYILSTPPFYTSDIRSIYRSLGLDAEQANQLYYELRLQHQFSGQTGDIYSADLKAPNELYKYQEVKASMEKVYGPMTDEEFDRRWDSRVSRYRRGSDFTHQMITTATERYRGQDQGIADNSVNALSDVLAQKTYGADVRGLSGWIGDVTDKAGPDPSIGDSDYRADLDAVNISRRIDATGLPYQVVQAQYYSELQAGTTNRAQEFNSHISISDIKHQVYSMVPEKYSTESEKLQYLKETYPQSYNFLRSVEKRDNHIVDYAKQEG